MLYVPEQDTYMLLRTGSTEGELSLHDCKIADLDLRNQNNQNLANIHVCTCVYHSTPCCHPFQDNCHLFSHLLIH